MMTSYLDAYSKSLAPPRQQPDSSDDPQFPVDVDPQDLVGDYTQPVAPQASAAAVGDLNAGLDKVEGQMQAENAATKQRGADQLARADELSKQIKHAGELSVEAAKQRTDAMSPYFAEAQTHYNDLNSRIESVSAQLQKDTAAQMQKWDAARLDAANSQLQDFFSSRTTSGQIVGIISAALGGFANGLAGQPGAPTPLDRIIQRDLDIQTQNLAQKNRTAEGERSKLQVLQESGLSQIQALSAMRTAIFDKVKLVSMDIANRTGTADAQAEAAKIGAQMDANNLQIRQQIENNTNQTIGANLRSIADIEGARSRFLAVMARAQAAGAGAGKDPLANDVEGFSGKDSQRAKVAGMVSALKTLAQLAKAEDDEIAPGKNANRRTQMFALLSQIYSSGQPGLRAQGVNLAQDALGGRYTGILTDTKDRRDGVLTGAGQEVINALGGAKPKGELAATLDKLGVKY